MLSPESIEMRMRVMKLTRKLETCPDQDTSDFYILTF